MLDTTVGGRGVLEVRPASGAKHGHVWPHKDDGGDGRGRQNREEGGGVGRQNVGWRASNEGAGCCINHVRALN